MLHRIPFFSRYIKADPEYADFAKAFRDAAKYLLDLLRNVVVVSTVGFFAAKTRSSMLSDIEVVAQWILYAPIVSWYFEERLEITYFQTKSRYVKLIPLVAAAALYIALSIATQSLIGKIVHKVIEANFLR